MQSIRLASDGIAFRKWEEFIKLCIDGDEIIEIDKEAFEALQTMAKEVLGEQRITERAL